ncbi:hypothetical protein M431DRAFT_485206 [Trichoderma harzianum CBS 226.95]|uniref:Secreted protein n=1 Tax=Trichoderma harzianum CBS 226.95 TaxID=983964 RepID=A0A2T4A2S3_TRIHA|nr:hypothetical protein M431DRAFT_485206 [Trichoderma harzianum CBS 226.95]PTB51360.1 hypothetical protein M431DRAFT_485206 [Trichoderma harzianum CBS 226.95]
MPRLWGAGLSVVRLCLMAVQLVMPRMPPPRLPPDISSSLPPRWMNKSLQRHDSSKSHFHMHIEYPQYKQSFGVPTKQRIQTSPMPVVHKSAWCKTWQFRKDLE